MTIAQYRDRIAEIPMVHALDAPVRERVSEVLFALSTASMLKPGDVVYKKGSEDNNTGAVLLEGELVVRGDNDHVFEVTAPNLIGEMLQLNKYGQRTATVSAKGDAVLLEFPWHNFVKTLLEDTTITQSDRATIKETFSAYAGNRLKALKDQPGGS